MSPRWAVLSRGTVYHVGRWKNGRHRHYGALWLAAYECWRLRRSGDPHAKVLWHPPTIVVPEGNRRDK